MALEGADLEVPSVSRGSGPLCLFLMQEVMKASDGSLLGDPRRTPLSKKEGVKWQRPRLTRQALMRCCLVKWILSSAAPQGSGRGCAAWEGGGVCSELSPAQGLRDHPGAPAWATPPLPLLGDISAHPHLSPFIGACSLLSRELKAASRAVGTEHWDHPGVFPVGSWASEPHWLVTWGNTLFLSKSSVKRGAGTHLSGATVCRGRVRRRPWLPPLFGPAQCSPGVDSLLSLSSGNS